MSDHDKRKYAATYVNTGGDKVAAWRAIRPKTKSDSAAKRSSNLVFNNPEVQGYIEKCRASLKKSVANIASGLTIYDEQTDKLTKTIAISEVQLINEYINAAMLDHLMYYKDGQPIPLEELAPELRRQIAEIEWEEGPGNTRRVRDYVLEDRSKARDQLAKITGIVNPAFDFAGLLAILTGKKKDDVQDDLKRLNHAEGVNFEAIKKKAGVLINNETGEVMP